MAKIQRSNRNDPQSDTEDVIQNTFLKIVKYIDRIDFSRGEKDVKNYVFAILSNEICNLLGENERIDTYDTVSDEKISTDKTDFINQLDMKNRYEAVVHAISKLDEKYSATLFLTFCKDMSVNGIAKLMGISEKTVYTRLKRGIELLRKSLTFGGVYYG